jgi:predicted nucleic acid-binding protein
LIVLDASAVALALLGNDGAAHRTRELLRADRLLAPELLDLEVVSYVRRGVRQGHIGSQRALQALSDLASLPVRRISHRPLLSRIWDLRDNVSAYDAAYVALAETFRAPLLTADARLARAPGLRCEVQLVA